MRIAVKYSAGLMPRCRPCHVTVGDRKVATAILEAFNEEVRFFDVQCTLDVSPCHCRMQ